jgi:hypothetical protein
MEIAYQDDKKELHHIKVSINPWLIFLIFLVAYVALDFFSMAAQDFLLTHLSISKQRWKTYFKFGIVFVIILFLVTWLTKIPLITIEQI